MAVATTAISNHCFGRHRRSIVLLLFVVVVAIAAHDDTDVDREATTTTTRVRRGRHEIEHDARSIGHREQHHEHHYHHHHGFDDDHHQGAAAVLLGHHDHDHHHHHPHGGGCHHHPPHPGGTEHDDDDDDDDDDYEYGENINEEEEEEPDDSEEDEPEEGEALEEERFDGSEHNNNINASSETERDLLLIGRRRRMNKKGKHKKGRGPGITEFRQCGVPNPSQDDIERTYQVLDDWEAQSPGRRQRLLDQLEENRRRRRRERQLMTMMPMLSNDTTTNSTDNSTASVNGTAGGEVVKNMIINVWYHVIRKGDTPQLGTWTLEQAQESVRLVNMYLADTPFQFQLVGMTQTLNANWFNCKGYAIELAYKSALRREGGDTLNVYMCDLLTAQGLWGYASLPAGLKRYTVYDGMVLANPFTKGYTALDAHMTFVHEAGHWLGLYHTWQGTCDPSRGGDAVFDTPAHVGPTWTYPGYKTCFDGITYNTCRDNVKGVDPGLDPLFNHMNYVDTPCQYAKGYFTDGQVVNMVSKFETYRWNKTTCRARGIPCRGNAQCCSGTCRVRAKLCS